MKIAIVTKRFLDLSETFIYQPLQIISRQEDLAVYALERRNRDDFSYDKIFTLDSLSGFGHFYSMFLGSLGFEPQIFQRMKKARTQLIHAHYGYMGLYGWQFARRLQIPLMVSFYGLDVYKHTSSFFYRLQLKKLFKRGSLFTVCSQKMKQDLIALGAPAEKVEVVYGAVDLQKYPFQLNENKAQTDILMCGRFVEKKGFIYGIRAFRRLTDPHLRLKIIGSGMLEAELKEAAAGDARIEFLGSQSYEQYMQQLQQSDILLVPSVTARDGDQEGLPTVLIEASALGTILVASRHSGIPEIVRNGYLAAEKDVKDLAIQLEQAVAQKKSWPQLAKRQLEYVKKNFDMQKQSEKIRRLYQKLCSE